MPRRRYLALIVPAILLTAALCRAQDASGINDLKARARSEIQRLPSLGRHDLEEVLTFTLRDGKIYPVTHLPPTGPDHSIQIAGLPGPAKISVFGNETIHSAQNSRYPQFVYCDLNVPGTVAVYTEVRCSPESVQISQDTALLQDGVQSVQFVQAAAQGPLAASLYIQISPPNGPQRNTRCSGASLAEICRQNSPAVDRYVRPMFRLLRQEQVVFQVDPTTAYQVLRDRWRPDPATIAATDAAVAGLDADSYSDREAAMSRLRSLGEPAALYLMNTPASHPRTTEQAMRVDTFLAAYQPLPNDQSRRLGSDPDFLLDCFFSPDPAIRRLAITQLARATGKPVDLNPDLTGPELWNAVTRLRLALTPPSTQP